MALRKSFYFFNGQRVIYEQKHHNGLQKEKQKDKKRRDIMVTIPKGDEMGMFLLQPVEAAHLAMNFTKNSNLKSNSYYLDPSPLQISQQEKQPYLHLYMDPGETFQCKHDKIFRVTAWCSTLRRRNHRSRWKEQEWFSHTMLPSSIPKYYLKNKKIKNSPKWDFALESSIWSSILWIQDYAG